jgi:large subunit ribosomal protein L18
VTARRGATRVLRIRRHSRVRLKVVGTPQRPRLAVSRSNRHISAQVIDDQAGRTLAAASTVEPGLLAQLGRAGTGNLSGAEAVGRLVASRAKDVGVTQVVFDRGGFAYHGRIAALADAARQEGLEF